MRLPCAPGSYTRAATRLRAKGKGAGIPKLEELFRRGPPWVYPPLVGGTVLVATRRSAGAKAIETYHRLTESGFTQSSVISYHRVRPTHRAHNWNKDPRCRIYAEYTRLESGPAHWTSRCLPSFVLIGTPKSGTTSLFNWILQHPDILAPVRKELHFWAPVLTPDKSCVDNATCAVFQSPKPATDSTVSSGKSARWPLTTIVAGRMLSRYLDLFPRVDPREFAITGEASPAYLYSPSVAIFLESALASQINLLVLLRDPADRAFSEFKNKRDLMVKGAPKASVWVDGHSQFNQLVASLRTSTAGCSPEQFYAACKACARFASAPGFATFQHGSTLVPNVGASRTTEKLLPATGIVAESQCVVPPVIWQSWYHLFIPRYQRRSKRLLIEFSDDLFDDPQAMMRRVGGFLGLPAFNYSTNVAYNTERKRGAYIAKVPQEPNVTVGKRGGNEADASKAESSRTKAAQDDMAYVQGLMRHSVNHLQGVLQNNMWDAPPQQHRRSLPRKWIERYGAVSGSTAA